MLQLLQLPLVSSKLDIVAPTGTHPCQLAYCDCSFGSSKSCTLPSSRPDPTPDDHYWIGQDCPKCNPKTDPTAHSSFAAYLSALNFHEKGNSTLQIIDRSVNFLELGIFVAPVSHPDPPHVCKDIPCGYCGRKWF